jgi:hypothetical protein
MPGRRIGPLRIAPPQAIPPPMELPIALAVPELRPLAIPSRARFRERP